MGQTREGIVNVLKMSRLIREIEEYLRSKMVADFLRKYDALIADKPKTHYFNFFGVNVLHGEIVSVKFYAHIFEALSEEELQAFVPVSDDYEQFSNLRTTSKGFGATNVGTILELKFKPGDANPIYGFYHNIDVSEEGFNAIGFPKSLPTSMKDACTALAVNFEYGDSGTVFKKYYQFQDELSKQYFAKRFDLPVLTDATFVEYAESNDLCKIHFSFGEKVFEAQKKLVESYSNEELEAVNAINRKYGLLNITFALYEEKPVKAMYFFDEGSNCNPRIRPLLNSEHIYSNTLQKVLHKLEPMQNG